MATEDARRAFASFIEQVRALYDERLDASEHWPRVADLLRGLLPAPGLRKGSRDWPVGQGKELVLHSDELHGFFVGALVRKPFHKAGAHDHAHTWTVYGVLDGEELTSRFERLDDGKTPGRAEIRRTADIPTPTGMVDVVGPWAIHAESNVGERSVAITVRSETPGSYNQNVFDMDAGTVRNNHRGLELVPFPI